ncbi:MAG: sulfurtransferase [Gammaproteobacteria bacterium]|nr:sulfurtransferase [Gammaproteobacteria bacterium]
MFDALIRCAPLRARLDDPRLRVIDCRFDLADTSRGESAFADAHLPGARYAHLDRDLSGPITPHSGRHPLPDAARLMHWLGEQGIGNDIQVVAYDDSGGTMAVRLWWLLRWLGHRRVAVLDGGWQAWTADGLPVETSAPSAADPARFDGRPDMAQVVSSDELARAVAAGSPLPLVMDARTGERFRGEAEPIDPVAGRVPGAINLPLQDNLAADGRFRPAAALRAIYLRALDGRAASDVVAMCGSGVTACHNLLAMEVAGLPGGRLYAGSWSEWIRDPRRPVVTGP